MGLPLTQVQASGKPEPRVPADAVQRTTRPIFPDGQWVAYSSNESGQFEVYAPFPAPAVNARFPPAVGVKSSLAP